MEALRVQEGKSIDYTPSGNVAAGDVVVLGNFVFVAVRAILANVLGALAAEGVFDVKKITGVSFAVGDPVFWDVDGTPVGGTGTGAAVANTALGNLMGICVEAAGLTDETVRTVLRSISSSATETLSLADLTDVGAATPTSGNLMVGDGNSFESVAVSGDATLSSAGAVTVNAAIKEKEVLIPIAELGAGADLSALTVFGVPRAATLTSLGYLSGGDGDFGTIDNSNTSVFVVTDGGGNTVVSKTYNTATQPTADAVNDLGALDGTHKVLTAAEICKLAITNGGTAKTPSGFLVVRYLSTNA